MSIPQTGSRAVASLVPGAFSSVAAIGSLALPMDDARVPRTLHLAAFVLRRCRQSGPPATAEMRPLPHSAPGGLLGRVRAVRDDVVRRRVVTPESPQEESRSPRVD